MYSEDLSVGRHCKPKELGSYQLGYHMQTQIGRGPGIKRSYHQQQNRQCQTVVEMDHSKQWTVDPPLAQEVYPQSWAIKPYKIWGITRGSPLWNATNANRNIVKELIFWEIKDGKSADFFQDSWHQLCPLSDSHGLPLLKDQLKQINFIKVNSFWEVEHRGDHYRRWRCKEWW